jgi:hypothetical protein
MMTTYKNCQSCGMPLKKSPNGGGTNADNSVSTMYCAYCFEEDWSAMQMQEFVKGKMKEMGFPGFLGGFFTKGIPKLERWKGK